MQPILFILGIRPCLEAILLLETLFNSAAPGTLSGRLRRIPVRDGVRAWDFDCALSLPSPLPAAPQNRYQILFCRSGALRVELAVGKQLFLHEREVLLLAPSATLARASVPDGRLAGGLVVVEVRRNDSLQNVLGSLLGGLTLDAVRLEERLNARSGCALLRGTPWTETVFSALQPLQPEARGRYCAFKTAELLYLLSTDSPLLPLPPEAPGRDRYQVELMRQVRDHMLAHLADPLTINQLSARFHISPTALKDCFRQTYGRPLHQYLLEHRVRRAAELLSESNLSIVEIASAVGYNSASQFGVAFKRRYHLTPSQFRRMAHTQKFSS